MSFNDWIGQKGYSYKSNDTTKENVENFEIIKKGNKWCYWGTETKVCMEQTNVDVLTAPGGEGWGWLQPDGEINWHNGYSSRLNNDPC